MSHIRNTAQVTPMNSPTGEIIHELGGNAVGGLSQHSFAVITLPSGGKSVMHYHPVAEESYYIMSGEAQVTFDEETLTLKVGEMLAIPATHVHQIRNESQQDLVFIAVCVPAWTPDNTVVVE